MVRSAFKAFTGKLGSDVSCQEVIKCVLELHEEDMIIYRHILKNGPRRVDEIAEFILKDRSTAYRELQKLIYCGICYKEAHNLKEGGYYFLYHSRSIEEVRKKMEECIDTSYEKLKYAIRSDFF